MARIAATRSPQQAAPVDGRNSKVSLPLPMSPRRLGWFKPALAGGLAASVAIAAAIWPVWVARERTTDRLRAELNQRDSQIQQMQSSVNDAQQLLQFVSASDIVAVQLAGQGTQAHAAGVLLWDPAKKKALFSATKLAALPPNRTFELWLIDNKQNKIPAGTFSLDSAGDIRMPVQDVPLPYSLAAVAVTDEPARVPQPTGSFQLLGAVK